MRGFFDDHRFGKTLTWAVFVQKLSKAFLEASGFSMFIKYLRDTNMPLDED